MQDSVIFFPDNFPFEDCDEFPDGTEALFRNGERFFYKNNSDTLVIFYHGNAASGCAWGFLAEIFDEANLSFIVTVYPGFSGDTRRPSIQKVKNYVNTIHEFSEKYERVKLLGYSIGTGAAAYHSSLGRYDELFLISSFPSIAEIASIQYPFYPVGLMLKDDFDIVRYLSYFDGHIVQVHGTDDAIVPIELAKSLHESLATEKRFVEINQDHNTMFSDIVLFEELAEFLER